jgi:hypothetical protein
MRREGLPGIDLQRILVSIGYERKEEVVPTLSMAIIKEDLWSFCCILGDPDYVAVASTGAAA